MTTTNNERWTELLAQHKESEVDLNALKDVPEGEWLCEPLIQSNSVQSLTAAAGTGKSLLMLEVAVGIATGRPCLLKPRSSPRKVLYLDFERTRSILRRRLESLGI